MANIIRVTVNFPNDLRNVSAYGQSAIVRIQSSSASGGSFSNVTTALLADATPRYTLFDQSGTSTTWYRARYEDGGGSNTSDWSTPFQTQVT